MEHDARHARSCAAIDGSIHSISRTVVPRLESPSSVGLDGASSLSARQGPRLFTDHEREVAADEPVQRAETPARWRALLSGSSPREILARIVPEDPLGMRSIVAARLRQQAYLLDADRVHLRSLALCARWASRYQGQPAFSTWLERLVDQAATELLREEQEDFAAENSVPSSAFAALADPLGLEPRAMQVCCRAFNRLPLEDRRAFFELVLRVRSLDELAREFDASAVEIARRARRALDTFRHPMTTVPAERSRSAPSTKEDPQ